MRKATLAAIVGGVSLVFLAGCGATLGQDGGRYTASKETVSPVPNGTVRYVPAVEGRTGPRQGFSSIAGDPFGHMSLREPVSELFAKDLRRSIPASHPLPADARLAIDIDSFRQDAKFSEVLTTAETTWTVTRGQQSVTRKLTMRRATLEGREGITGRESPAEQLPSMAAEACERFFEDAGVQALLN